MTRRFYSLSPTAEALALEVPGVKPRVRGMVDVPENAVEVVAKLLTDMREQHAISPPPQAMQTFAAPQGLRPLIEDAGLSLQDFATEYQRREVSKWLYNGSCLFHWACGAGKSLGSLVVTSVDPSPIVICTGAKGRSGWAAQIARFTTEQAVVLYGQDHVEKVEQQLTAGLHAGATKWEVGRFKALIKEFEHSWPCTCEALEHKPEIIRHWDAGNIRLFARFWLKVGQHRLNGETYQIREPAIPAGVRYVVCGWETLPWHVEKLTKLRPGAVILDEVQTIKSHQRWKKLPAKPNEHGARKLDDGQWAKFKRLDNIVSSADLLCKASRRRVALSATPIKDRVRDLWAIYDYLAPGEFGNYNSFTKRYCLGHQNIWGGWDDRGSSNLEELYARVSTLTSFVSPAEAARNLPPLRNETIFIPRELLGEADADLLREVKALAKESQTDEGGGSTSFSARVSEVKLAMACSRKRRVIADDVIEAANSGSKVCIWTARRKDVDVLLHMLTMKGSGLEKNVRVWGGHGGKTPEERAAIRDEYMACPSHAVLIGTGFAFGVQLDLQDTDIGIMAMLPWTIADYLQWRGRWYRQGGWRALLVRNYVAEGTVDEHISNILLRKLPAIEKMSRDGSTTVGVYESLVGNAEELTTELMNAIMRDDFRLEA